MVRCIDIRYGPRPPPNRHALLGAPARPASVRPASVRPACIRPASVQPALPELGTPVAGEDLSRCMSLSPCTMEAGSAGILTTKQRRMRALLRKMPVKDQAFGSGGLKSA